MKRLGCWIVLSLLLVTTAFAQNHSHATMTHSYAGAVRIAAPSVVNVYTIRDRRFSSSNNEHNFAKMQEQLHPALQRTRSQKQQKKNGRYRLGSGVIMNKQGYILTNHHVIQHAKQVLIALGDGRKVQAKVVGSDPETDLAVLRIRLPDLVPIQLDNSEHIQVGDVVLAIGNPFGLGQTVTQGIISAVGRSTIGINPLESYIQTDAAINPGNSGGALVNTHGKLIGINSGMYTRTGGYQGVGFAIPLKVALNIMNQITRYGYVKRGYVGAAVVTLTLNMARRLGINQATGAVITKVLKGSPADIYGLKSKDVITHIDRFRVRSSRGFMNYIAQSKPGTVLKFIILRGGQTRTVPVSIGIRPPPKNIDERGRVVVAPRSNGQQHNDGGLGRSRDFVPDRR